MKIFEIYQSLFEEDIKFEDDHINHHHGQDDFHIELLVDGETVAYADYTDYRGEITIKFIESLVKGKGYGQMIMRYLANKYGYENLERTSLTPSGAKMRQNLDKEFGFDYQKHQESKNKHLSPDVINSIKSPEIKEFLNTIVNIGYREAWDMLRESGRMRELIDYAESLGTDMNDIANIADWIKGSKSNDNYPEDEVPDHIIDTLNILK